MEPRISTKEFIKRCESAGDMFIGSKVDGLKAGKLLIKKLEFHGFEVEFLDNPPQQNYSANMWIKPKWDADSTNPRFTLNAACMSTIVKLRPDEFSLEPDGSFRMWWD